MACSICTTRSCSLRAGTAAISPAGGIGDLYRYFLKARHQARATGAGLALYNVLEEIVIRRTRPFVRRAYPEATIGGKRIHFPQRKLKTVQYDLEATYGGIYEEVVAGIESLKLAPYKLETFKKKGVQRDEFEARPRAGARRNFQKPLPQAFRVEHRGVPHQCATGACVLEHISSHICSTGSCSDRAIFTARSPIFPARTRKTTRRQARSLKSSTRTKRRSACSKKWDRQYRRL